MDIQLPLRIMAVDPATGKSGWAILDLECLSPLSICIVAHGQIDGEKLLRTKKEMSQTFERQFCILDALDQEYESLIRRYNPSEIVCEGTYGHLHLAALISLTLAINTLRRASYRTINKPIHIIPPTITKLAFTGKGGSDKEAMMKSYLNSPYLIRTDATEISEHEVDAIGHGYGWIARDILKTVVQQSAAEKRQRRQEKLKKKKQKETKVRMEA